MKISIITTVYKAEQDLPRLLDSMMAQKAPELEFFLIDNGSPDRCGEICREYAEKDPRFTVYTLEENIGYIRARNLGLEVCDGDYVGFCDSDDFLEPGGYDRAVEVIRDTDCDFYAAAYRTLSDAETVNLLPFAPGLYQGEQVKDTLLPQAFGYLPGRAMLHGFMWKHIIRRSIVTGNAIRFYEPLKPYEDQLFNIDVLKRSRRVFIDDHVIYNYIVNAQSITAKLTANFDAEGEWARVKGLYEQKLRRSENALQHTALCSQGLMSLYAMVLNMAKTNAISAGEGIAMLREFGDDGTLAAICRDADASGSAMMTFVRWCLMNGHYRLLLTAITLGLKLRRN